MWFPHNRATTCGSCELANVLDDTYDYLEPNFRMECERHIPDTDEIDPAEAANAYLYLKANFDSNRV